MKATPQSITSFRKQMRADGLMPLPVNGKKPVLEEWQKKTKINDDESRFGKRIIRMRAIPVCLPARCQRSMPIS